MLLNKKGEWNHCKIPRLKLEEVEEDHREEAGAIEAREKAERRVMSRKKWEVSKTCKRSLEEIDDREDSIEEKEGQKPEKKARVDVLVVLEQDKRNETEEDRDIQEGP